MSLNIIVSFIILVVISKITAEESPVINIRQGGIKGQYQYTSKGRKFSAFTGIPYGRPPIDALRFKPPKPAVAWDDVFDATKTHPVCLQHGDVLRTIVVGKEDCLYLNVYTPETFESDNVGSLPVMVFIHGGGFVRGSANDNGPDLLLNKDVILVTINYRLGPMGFLSSGTMDAIGNNGLKDQTMALKWVKSNIKDFGGDSNRITVVGQSAGGVSAHYHMLSPLSKGLINGVIAQSGTALANWALMPHFLNARYSKFLAGSLGCDTFHVDEMMVCLRSADAEEIINKTSIFREWYIEPTFTFKPIIEPDLPYAFIAEDPINIIKSGNAAKVPFLTGIATDEGDFKINGIYNQPNLIEELNKNFDEYGAKFLAYRETLAPKYEKSAIESIKKFYLNIKRINKKTKKEVSEMYADAWFLAGMDASVQLHVKNSQNPVYVYLFGYKGSKSYCNRLLNSNEDSSSNSVCHCDELLYLFNNKKYLVNFESFKEDDKMAELLTTMWTNFATYGKPTVEENLIAWEPVTQSKQSYLDIKSSENLSMKTDMYSERVNFWRNLELSSRTVNIRDEL